MRGVQVRDIAVWVGKGGTEQATNMPNDSIS